QKTHLKIDQQDIKINTKNSNNINKSNKLE
ncbi:MAG: hypothetical protein ACI8O8_001763, partial [Oleiphilaceae bacterium]